MRILLSDQRVTFNKQAFPKNGWAIMMAGIPGSGKSSAIKNYLLIDAITFDSDKIKMLVVNKVNSDMKKGIQSEMTKAIVDHFNGRIPNMANEEDASEMHQFLIREKRLFSKSIAQFLKNKRLKENFIIDATGNKAKAITNSSETFKNLGYKICVVLVATNLKIAKDRALSRQNSKNGRAVPEEYIDEVYNSLIKNFPEVLNNLDTNVVDEFWVILNNEEFDLLAKQGNCIKLKKENDKFVLDDELLKKIQASKSGVMMGDNIFNFFDNVLLAATDGSNKNVRTLISSKEELAAIVRKDYTDALRFLKTVATNRLGEFESGFFRGAKAYNADYGLLIKPGIRISENANNLYTILMSEILQSWQKYPKRNRSHICTNTYNVASTYGDVVYMVLPKNNTNIGVCFTSDIWYSFSTKYRDVAPEISKEIRKVLYAVLKKRIDIRIFLDAQKTIELFEEFDSKISETNLEAVKNNLDGIAKEIFVDLITEKSSFLKFIETNIFNTNRFELVNIKNFSDYNENKELWFEDTALYIEEENFKLISELLEEID